jgi:hypothetical protein
MMTSGVYRQTSQISEERLQHDPDNALLSRMPLRRLDAESVRDAIFYVAGRLDETPFGPPDEMDVRRDGLVKVRGTERGWRRSIYAQQRRSQLATLLEAFDLPQMSPNCVSRPNSTVAPQALQLLNDGQIHELVRSLAKRVSAEAGADPSQQVDRLFAIALNRLPSSEERQLLISSMEAFTADWLEHRREIEIESTAETWIRESDPEKEYDKNLIYVHSRKSVDKSRRYSLLEFDLKHLRGVKIRSARLELSPVQSNLRVRQHAALVPPGIAEATWKMYQDQKQSSEDVLESLGVFNLTTKVSDIGKYCASKSAADEDLRKLQARIDADGTVTLALIAVEDGKRYQAEWDDGEGPSTNGKKPRLVLHCESMDGSEPPPQSVVEFARLSALENLCHVMINSPEFIYVD